MRPARRHSLSVQNRASSHDTSRYRHVTSGALFSHSVGGYSITSTEVKRYLHLLGIYSVIKQVLAR